MANTNRLVVQINGVKFPIRTPEDPSYVSELGRELDKSVRELILINPNVSINEALVLTCLSYMDNYHKAEKNADNLRAQLVSHLGDPSKARSNKDGRQNG